MNDGTEWKILRSWVMQTMKSVGFGKREMIEMVRNELILLLDSINKKGPLRLKLLITRPVINVLWFFTSGQAFATNARYINTRVLLDFSTLWSTVSTFGFPCV